MSNISYNTNSLYIHIPFCSSICSYCDFYKMIAKEDLKDKYIDYLIRELELKSKYLTNLKTIYIGGGTPTSLKYQTLEKLLLAVSKYINEDLIEYTIEANPNDLDLKTCQLLSKYHINRVSMGLQGVNLEKLELLNRNHSFNDCTIAVTNLTKCGITNINVDYIYGLYFETITSVKEELTKILTLPITHISCYSLILESHTILYNKYMKNEFQLLDEDLESELYYFICKFLKERGFNHYEISNFAKGDCYSKHNLVYWKNQTYVAVGANSSGYQIIDSKHIRYTNINNLNKYFAYIDTNISNYSEYNELDEIDCLDNYIMLGLRLIEGISLEYIKEKYLSFYDNIISKVDYLVKMELLECSDSYIKIPENKLYVSNAIILELLDSYKV